MQYRELGGSGIKISIVALGCWAMGGSHGWRYQEDKDSIDTIHRALDIGINFIDTAPVYGYGRADEIVGKALRNRREKVILATKVGISWGKDGEYRNATRERVFEEIEESLRRLQTDYIDLYQVHWPDPKTPIEETATALSELLKKGKIRAAGISNYAVEEMKEFMKYCPLASLQPFYNMFGREIDKKILPFCQENDIGIIAYSPLYNGILTGKFFRGAEIPDDLRRNNLELKGKRFDINLKAIKKLDEIARKYNHSLAQLAISWVISQPGITSAICGARRTSQIEENAAGSGLMLNKEDMDKIETVLCEREQAIASLSL